MTVQDLALEVTGISLKYPRQYFLWSFLIFLDCANLGVQEDSVLSSSYRHLFAIIIISEIH